MQIKCRRLLQIMIPCTVEVLRVPDGIGEWGSEERADQPYCLLMVQSKSIIHKAPKV